MDNLSEHKKPRLKAVIETIVWSAIYVLTFVIFQLIVGLIVLAIFVIREIMVALSAGTINAQNSEALAELIQDLVISQMAASMPWTLLISSILTLLVIWVIVGARGFEVRKFAGLNPVSWVQVVSATFLGIGFSLAFNSLFNMPGLEVMQDPSTAMAQSLLFGSIFTAIIGSTVVPIVEEIVFRGFLLNEMRRGVTLLPSVLLSSLLFGVLHGTAVWALIAAVLGLLLAWVALRSRSVYAAIATHIGINATSFTMVWTDEMWSVPAQSSSFAILLALGATLFIASLIVLIRNSKPLSQLEPAPEPIPKKPRCAPEYYIHQEQTAYPHVHYQPQSMQNDWYSYVDKEAEQEEFAQHYNEPPKRWFQK